jgi:hypothetical protein
MAAAEAPAAGLEQGSPGAPLAQRSAGETQQPARAAAPHGGGAARGCETQSGTAEAACGDASADAEPAAPPLLTTPVPPLPLPRGAPPAPGHSRQASGGSAGRSPRRSGGGGKQHASGNTSWASNEGWCSAAVSPAAFASRTLALSGFPPAVDDEHIVAVARRYGAVRCVHSEGRHMGVVLVRRGTQAAVRLCRAALPTCRAGAAARRGRRRRAEVACAVPAWRACAHAAHTPRGTSACAPFRRSLVLTLV